MPLAAAGSLDVTRLGQGLRHSRRRHGARIAVRDGVCGGPGAIQGLHGLTRAVEGEQLAPDLEVGFAPLFGVGDQ
jgi:hypothetical protein